MKLDGRQFAQLQGVLLQSFDRDSLRMMVRLQLDEDLDAVAGDDDLTTVVFDLITWAERTNRIRDLVNGALASNPANPELQQLAAEAVHWPALAAAPSGAATDVTGRQATAQRPVEQGRSNRLFPPGVAAIVAILFVLVAFWLLRPYLLPGRPIDPAPVEPTLPVVQPTLPEEAPTAMPTASETPQPSPTATPVQTPTEAATEAPTEAPTKAPQPPRAPALRIGPAYQSFGEQSRLWTVKSGESMTVDLRRLWSAPEGTPVDCASGVIFITWQVRQPYPGGDELEIRRAVPRSGGLTEVLGSGARGSLSAGYCDELSLHNLGLEEYRVEWRYASALPR